MAAWPLATRPAELPAPVWAGVARKPVWNGLVFMKAVIASPAFTKQELLRLMELMAFCSAPVEHSRRAKYSHQKASGHLSLLPTEMGAMPAAFNFVTSLSSWFKVAGGE